MAASQSPCGVADQSGAGDDLAASSLGNPSMGNVLQYRYSIVVDVTNAGMVSSRGPTKVKAFLSEFIASIADLNPDSVYRIFLINCPMLFRYCCFLRGNPGLFLGAM